MTRLSLVRVIAALPLAVGSVAWPAVAHAQLDTTRRVTTVRAGPDHAFPQVARLPIASNVHIHGCTAAATRWCDVQSGRTRGWLPADDLSQSRRLRDAPALAFSVAEYWEAHYRRRAWFPTVDQWKGWGTPGFVAPATPRS